MKFKITTVEAGKRLDLLLVKKLPDLSRSVIKKHIQDGYILVNGQKIKARYKLSNQDEVSINLPKESAPEELEPEKINLDIIYEDDDILIINKPPGMVVHPDQIHISGTLVNALLNYFPAIKNVGDPARPGIVHRLDKDTSGLIICAKNNEAYKDLVSKFKKREVAKKYYALVFGRVKDQSGVIAYSLGKSQSKKLKMATVPDKEALTKYKIKKYYSRGGQNYTLLEVSPKTGRTHQIRVHLTRIGHPIVGDNKYSFKKQKDIPAPARQFLHAFYLKFKLPSGQDELFKIALPEDLDNFLSGLQG